MDSRSGSGDHKTLGTRLGFKQAAKYARTCAWCQYRWPSLKIVWFCFVGNCPQIICIIQACSCRGYLIVTIIVTTLNFILISARTFLFDSVHACIIYIIIFVHIYLSKVHKLSIYCLCLKKVNICIGYLRLAKILQARRYSFAKFGIAVDHLSSLANCDR